MNARPEAPSPEVLLGVRAIEVLLANAAVLVAFSLLGAIAGYLLSFNDERPFITSATLEVGVRYPKEPLENSLVAKERLAGHLAEAARRSSDPAAQIHATARRDPSSRALMRYIDLTVSAKTASAAATITKRGIDTFLAEHAKLYEYERGLVERERMHYERWATLLEAATARADAPDLGDAKFETERLYNIAEALLSEFRTPPTRIITRPTPPEQPPSRAKTLAIGGALIGVFAGAFFASIRHLKKSLA